jgi:hypothetical protein
MASFAWAGVPDLSLSTATTGAPAGVSVYNSPNGLGDPLTIARTATGVVHNATITLTLVDALGVPIPFYPSEDMMLDTTGGNFAFCPNGTAANLSTDVNGQTTWANPLAAGGSSFGFLVNVLISNAPLNQAGLNIIFNSADIDGDLRVNVADLTPFSQDYVSPVYAYRSDFARDGDVNVSDLTQFARAYAAAASCP